MYLSRLKLNPRQRSTRELYLSPYLLHQAVFQVFPDRREGGPGRVLYRLDADHRGYSNLLVQSEKKPDWNKAAMLQQTLLDPAACREYSPKFYQGQALYFKLRANPSVKKQAEDRKNGFRLGLFGEDKQLAWLQNKANRGGFSLIHRRVIPEGIIRDKKATESGKLSHYSVCFEGILAVNNPEAFLKTLENGIGPAKGFGFGLLSVAPVKS